MAIVRAWQLAFAAKNAAQHAADDLATDFAADRAGGTADELFAGRGARAAHATAKNGAQAVKQTTAGRCRCRAVIARFGRRPGPGHCFVARCRGWLRWTRRSNWRLRPVVTRCGP